MINVTMLFTVTSFFTRESYKDAVFISTHKFVGGPGTPGKSFILLIYLFSYFNFLGRETVQPTG